MDVVKPKKRGRKPKNLNKDKETEVKIPKKRGRKPKNINKVEVKIPKKRGRKPKKKIENEEDNNFTKINNNETVILHLPSTIELEKSTEVINDEEPKPFNNTENNLYLLSNELNLEEVNIPKTLKFMQFRKNLLKRLNFDYSDIIKMKK